MKRVGSMRALRIVAAMVLVICVFCICWQIAGVALSDTGATVTQHEGMTREEIQAELDRTVSENMMTISVAPTATITADGQLRVNVINDRDNRFSQRFTVLQNDVAQYESGVIAPGDTVEFCPAGDIEPGDAAIEIQAVDSTTGRDHGNPTRINVTVIRASDRQDNDGEAVTE